MGSLLPWEPRLVKGISRIISPRVLHSYSALASSSNRFDLSRTWPRSLVSNPSARLGWNHHWKRATAKVSLDESFSLEARKEKCVRIGASFMLKLFAWISRGVRRVLRHWRKMFNLYLWNASFVSVHENLLKVIWFVNFRRKIFNVWWNFLLGCIIKNHLQFLYSLHFVISCGYSCTNDWCWSLFRADDFFPCH